MKKCPRILFTVFAFLLLVSCVNRTTPKPDSTDEVSQGIKTIGPTPTDWKMYYDLENPSLIKISPLLKELREVYLAKFSVPGWFHLERKENNFFYEFLLEEAQKNQSDTPPPDRVMKPPHTIWSAWYELDQDGLLTGNEIHIYMDLERSPLFATFTYAEPMKKVTVLLDNKMNVTDIVEPTDAIQTTRKGLTIGQIDLSYLKNLRNYAGRDSEIEYVETVVSNRPALSLTLKKPYDGLVCDETPRFNENTCGIAIQYDIDLNSGYPITYTYALIGESGKLYPDSVEEITEISNETNLPPEIEQLYSRFSGD